MKTNNCTFKERIVEALLTNPNKLVSMFNSIKDKGYFTRFTSQILWDSGLEIEMCINKTDAELRHYNVYSNILSKSHNTIQRHNSKFVAKIEVANAIEFNFRLSNWMDYVDLYNYLATIDPAKLFINKTCGIHIHCDLTRVFNPRFAPNQIVYNRLTNRRYLLDLLVGYYYNRTSTYHRFFKPDCVFKNIKFFKKEELDTCEYRFLKPTVSYKNLIRYLLDVQIMHQVVLHELKLKPLNQNKIKLLTGKNNIGEFNDYIINEYS